MRCAIGCPSGWPRSPPIVLKQGWASLFGSLLLIGMIGSAAIWRDEWTVTRHDAVLIHAIAIQAAFLWLRLEAWRGVKIIALFHMTGTMMEIFKVDAGSRDHPEAGLIKLWGVPLFRGSCTARSAVISRG